jgi:hypothetical protein
MTGVEVAAAMVFAWAVRKAKRVGGRADGVVDEVIDSLGDRAHASVMAALQGSPAADVVDAEARQDLPVMTPEVRTGLEEAIAAAVEADPEFQQTLEKLAAAVEKARGGTPVVSTGDISASGNTVTGHVVTAASVSGNTFSDDTTTNNFNDKTVVSNGEGAQITVTF